MHRNVSSPDAISQVRKAVFPIAGLGSRFLPATKASPKEMLAVIDKPLIQYAVEEAYASGIRHMIFVTGRNKRAVEDHFDTAYELESELERTGKFDLLRAARSIAPPDMLCAYVRQHRPMGLGHAVLCARELVGDEPFAVLLADDLMVSKEPVLSQLIQRHKASGSSVLAVAPVPLKDVSKYGIVDGSSDSQGVMNVRSIVEKPSPEATKSTMAVVGRYILTPDVFEVLASMNSQPHGLELQLTDAIAVLIQRSGIEALEFEGRRFDCGNKLGMLEATLEIARLHPDVSDYFHDWLRIELAQRGSAPT